VVLNLVFQEKQLHYALVTIGILGYIYGGA